MIGYTFLPDTARLIPLPTTLLPTMPLLPIMPLPTRLPLPREYNKFRLLHVLELDREIRSDVIPHSKQGISNKTQTLKELLLLVCSI